MISLIHAAISERDNFHFTYLDLANLSTQTSANMEGNIPQKDKLQARAMEGHPITQSEASTIAANESDMTGRGPIKGGAAVTAQSIHNRQQNFLEKAGDIARKPVGEITKKDAAEVQSAEA